MEDGKAGDQNVDTPNGNQGNGAGGDPAERKRRIDAAVDGYQRKDVREFLGKYRGNAEAALEAALDLINDASIRTGRKVAGLEYDLEAAQGQIKAEQARVKEIQTERDTFKGQIDTINRGKTLERVGKAISDLNPQNALAAQMGLEREGFDFEVDGDAVYATKDGKRHQLKTVLNQDFYQRYPFARPAGDTPHGSQGRSSDYDPAEEAAKAAREEAKSASTDWSKF